MSPAEQPFLYEQPNLQENAVELFARKKQLLLAIKSTTSPLQIAREVKCCLAESGIDESQVPANLKEIRDDFLTKARPTAASIKLLMQKFHLALQEKGKKIAQKEGGDLSEIIDAIKPDCAFEKYVLSHIGESENVRNLMVIFCDYLIGIIARPDEKLESLMAGFPPIEENCVPGTSGRIALLKQSRFVKPENVTTISAYSDAIARLTVMAQEDVAEGNQTHIPFSIDWQLRLKDEERLAREDKFYKLPFFEMGPRSQLLLAANFRKIFLKSVEEDLLRIEKYLGEFFLPAEELVFLNQLLERYGVAGYEELDEDENESSTDNKDASPKKYRLTAECAKQLVETVSAPLALLEDTQEYHALLATEEEFENSLSVETAAKIARALSSANDMEFLEALRLFAIFAKPSAAGSKWQIHNICYELFCDSKNPDKFCEDEDLFATIQQRLDMVANPDDKKVGSDWLGDIKTEVKKLNKTYNPNLLYLRKYREFRGDYIPAVSEGVDHGIIIAALDKLANKEPKLTIAQLVKISRSLLMGADDNPATDNKNLKAFLQRPKADLVVEKLTDQFFEALAREPQTDAATLRKLLSVILPLTVQTNDPEALRIILQMPQFAAIDLIKGCNQMINYNLGYGLFRELDGSASIKKPEPFLARILFYLQKNPVLAKLKAKPEAELSTEESELKKAAIKLANDMLDYAIFRNAPSAFQNTFQQLVTNGPIDIKDIGSHLLQRIVDLDRVNFIPTLKECGFPKEKFLELNKDSKGNFLHEAVAKGSHALASEFIRVFQPKDSEVYELSEPMDLAVTSLFGIGNRDKFQHSTVQVTTNPHQFTALEIAVYSNHSKVITAMKDHIDFSKLFILKERHLKFLELSDPSKAESEAPILRLCYKTKGKQECLKTLLTIVKERLDLMADTDGVKSFLERRSSQEAGLGFNLSNPQKEEMRRLEKMVLSCGGREFHREFFQSVDKARKVFKDAHRQNREGAVTGVVTEAKAAQAANSARLGNPAIEY